MRKSIWLLTTVVMLGAVSYAAQCFSYEPYAESFGYSSDDAGGTSYLGVDTRNVTTDRLGALNLKDERGVEVTMVDQDAPAGKAGMKEHDVILSINGAEVESVEALRRMIRETPPGRVITVGVSRNGQPLNLKVQLADRRRSFNYAYKNDNDFHFEMPAIPAIPPIPAIPDMDVPMSVVVVHSSMRSGLMIENLTPQLGDYFGVKNGHGVLVRSVEKGSRADKAGLRAGDIITKINGEAISDSSDFSHALRSRKGSSNTVTLGILRDRKEQSITLTLPERKESSFFEESFEIPEFDAETEIKLTNLNSEMARLGPQLDLAVRSANRTLEETRRAFRNSTVVRDQQRAIRKQREELRKQQHELQKELLNQQHQVQDEMKSEQQQLRDEVRKEIRALSEI
jgi:membrane-associated protease RseP (regulator of RpoE activity)